MKRYIEALDNRRREIENEVDSKNPFDAGVMRAIEASKKSLALNQEQEHRAIRKGLHMFSDALTKQYGDPRFRERDGTLGKVASLGPAISAGLEGYEAEGEKIQHDMKEVLEVARKIRDSEIKRLREQDKEAFDAYFKDKQLGLEYEKLLEQERYHQGLLDNKGGAIKEFNNQPYKVLDKVEQRDANNEAKQIHQIKHDLKGIDGLYANLKNITKKNIANPVGALSLITNPVKDITGRVFKANKLQEETAARNLLFSELGKFRAHAERTLKGGVLGQGMYDRLTPFFPNENDDLPTFESKLNYLDKKFKELSEVADIRSKHGINYNFGDYAPVDIKTEEVKSALPSNNINSNNRKQEEWIKIQGPSGETEEIYFEDAPNFLNKPGYIRVE